MADEPDEGSLSQLVVVYEDGPEEIVYSSAYTNEQCAEGIEDCRAKYGNAHIMAAKVDDWIEP
jgi:hypothetical protein